MYQRTKQANMQSIEQVEKQVEKQVDEKVEEKVDEEQTVITEGKEMLDAIVEAYKLYFKHGSRSSKKVDYFHTYLKTCIESAIIRSGNEDIYSVKLEQNVDSSNSSGKKRCDIVINKSDKPYIVFPVKMIMTNYKQNKNNSWENLTGELLHLKWSNPNIILIPINIMMSDTPYLNKKSTINKFEKITYDDIKQYEILKTKDIAYEILNYIIDVTHIDKIGETYKTLPDLDGYNTKTQYNSFHGLLAKLLI